MFPAQRESWRYCYFFINSKFAPITYGDFLVVSPGHEDLMVINSFIAAPAREPAVSKLISFARYGVTACWFILVSVGAIE